PSPPGGFPPPPSAPPPRRTPSSPGERGFGGTRTIDARRFSPCLFRFAYVWMRNGNSFWFYPVFISRNFVAGYRWRFNRWVYFGTNLNRIAYFTC
ncbi:transporter, partial [Brevibacillus centrosporus]